MESYLAMIAFGVILIFSLESTTVLGWKQDQQQQHDGANTIIHPKTIPKDVTNLFLSTIMKHVNAI